MLSELKRLASPAKKMVSLIKATHFMTNAERFNRISSQPKQILWSVAVRIRCSHASDAPKENNMGRAKH